MRTAAVAGVAQIWRYPVKSMRGERVERADLAEHGVAGDRTWAVRDEVRGGIRGAKKLPGLMGFAARYPAGDAARPPLITTPDGVTFAADTPDAAAQVSKALGHEVTLWPLQPADDLDHYRRGAPDSDDVLVELASIFGREQGEPLPDLSAFPAEIVEFESPPGTYVDAYPLLLMTRAALDTVAALAPGSAVDVRRFRPNLLLDTETAGHPELDWIGRRLRIGDAVVRVVGGCPRCVMVTHGFADLPKDRAILRAIVRELGQDLGVYGVVEAPGAVRIGTPVTVLD